jgi:hypothetical protein
MSPALSVRGDVGALGYGVNRDQAKAIAPDALRDYAAAMLQDASALI